MANDPAADVGTDDGAGDWPPPALADRFAFLLKHAQTQVVDLAEPALAPVGVDGREFGAMAVFADEDQLSQQQAAQRLAIDRTTMVMLIDGLEAKGLVARRPHPDDRRKNVVALTDAGRQALRRATRAVEAAEQQFLAPLTDDEAAALKRALNALVARSAPQSAH